MFYHELICDIDQAVCFIIISYKMEFISTLSKQLGVIDFSPLQGKGVITFQPTGNTVKKALNVIHHRRIAKNRRQRSQSWRSRHNNQCRTIRQGTMVRSRCEEQPLSAWMCNGPIGRTLISSRTKSISDFPNLSNRNLLST